MSARRGGWLAWLSLAGLALFTSLGIWQLQRLSWKLDLIARVDARVSAAPLDAPGPQRWPAISAAGDEYRHVRLQGRWLAGREAAVQALTALGAGYWILTPLCTDADGGWCVLVNRGFVSGAARDGSARAARLQALQAAGVSPVVSGLLRLTETRGGFLRRNDPQAGRWYSRDVAAIAATLGVPHVAPYFIDADAAGGVAAVPGAAVADPAQPVGGLTVVAFRNQHLQYALTWFALALLSATGLLLALRERRGTAAD